MSTLSRFQLNAIVRAMLASGGLPARSWNVSGQMQVGINAGGSSYYSARRFANVLFDMSGWAPVTSGGGARTPGTWSQMQGTLNGDGDGTGTDGKYFRAPIASTAYGMPAGVYTVFNPSGQEFGVGQFGNTVLVPLTTAKYVTFTYTPAATGMYLWCRRSLQNTGAGNLQIILPGCVGDGTVNTSTGTYLTNGTHGITAGNPWNPDYLTFCQGLSLQHLRWMTTLGVIGSVETDWADRVLPTSISFSSQFGTGNAMPHEFAIDFANRTGIDPWVNIPPQATDAYVAACAAVYAANLNTNRRVLPEYSNEAWNFSSAYLDGTKYVNYLQYTKHFATVSDASNTGAPVFLATAHGRSVGDVLVLLATRENAPLGTNSIFFMQQGYTYSISAVTDANHFTLDLAGAGRTIPAGLVNIQYVWAAEPGKSSSGAAPDQNFATRQLAIWDAFDAALGVSRVVHSCASQAANAGVTSNRLSTGAMPTRAEHVHTAPYYSGLYWRVAFTGSGSTITPSCWASVGGTIYYGIYAAGSTPSKKDVALGAGAGFISGSSQAVSAMTVTTGTAVTGMTDGVNYAAFAVFKETNTGFIWMIGTGTDALNPTNVLSTSAAGAQYCYDTFANQATRCRLNQVATSNEVAHNAAIAAAGSSATLTTYEGGPDFKGTNCPLDLTTWLLVNYFPSTAHAGTFTHSLNHLARVGFRGHNQFLDIQGGGSIAAVGDELVYDLVPNELFTATAVDGRYAAMAAFGGAVTAQAAIPGTVSANRNASPITSAPGAFPYTVYSGLPGGYTYSKVSGDWMENFAVSGTSIVMVNATGVNFGGYSPETLTIEANDGYSSTSFKLSVPIGNAWYESDAQFVWDSVGAAAGTSMTPPSNPPFAAYGSALVEIAGTGNPVITSSSGTVSNDLWKMATYVFAGTSGMVANIPTNAPFLVAHVVDVGDQTTTFQYQLGIGAASNSVSYGVGSSATNSRWRLVVAGVTIFSGLADCASNPAKGTKVVKWLYVDPVAGTAIAGVNQTPYNTAALSGLTIGNATIGPDVRIGTSNGGASSQSQMYHGSLQALGRAGLTQTQALAIVQNMQTHHGI